MASSLAGLSASVTRILYLTGFPKELKTKDIQSAFSEWEGVSGGFKIKWRDDTSLLIVFQDASVAKRAYLHTVAFPPPILTAPSGVSASIRPYDGPDAQAVIQNVNSRGQHAPSASRSHSARSSSISAFPGQRSHSLSVSSNGPTSGGFRNGAVPNSAGSVTSPGIGGPNGAPVQHVAIPENIAGGREPSPTLPNIPSHPTLNALIEGAIDPAIVGAGPRIGDPGKRMVGAALGVRHPGLPPRMVGGGAEQMRPMGGMVVAE